MDDDNDDSQEEFDREEVEVALYSQIHFGSGLDDETVCQNQTSRYANVTLPFRVKVKELPRRVTPVSTVRQKQPVFDGDFIAFTRSDDDANVLSSEQQLSNESEPVVDKASTSDQEKSDRDTRTEGGDSDAFLAFHYIERDLKISKSDSAAVKVKGKHSKNGAKLVPENSETMLDVESTSEKIEQKENKDADNNLITAKNKSSKAQALESKNIGGSGLLPFTITKAAKKSKKSNKSEENALSDNNKKEEVSTISESKPAAKSNKKNTTKLDNFLKLSSSDPAAKIAVGKKVPLTKVDAAVLPRKPPVRLRRPPPVVVKYRQDSDTNTDYSDSEASCASTPVKKKKITKSSVLQSTDHPSLSSNEDNVKGENYRQKIDVSGKDSVAVERESKREDVVSIQQKADNSSESDDNGESEGEASSSSDDEDSSENKEQHLGEASDPNENVTDDDDNDSEDTDDSESSEQMDSLSETNPDLEFNLDGGVDGLLQVHNKTEGDQWKINEQDRYNVTSIHSRYFSPRSIQCRNCKGEGHMSRDCPEPMQRPCIFCGIIGHAFQSCPNAICYNCDAPGHRTQECREPKRNWNGMCDRCWMPGHVERMCPDRWRQYHMTVESKSTHLVKTSKGSQNPRVYCYNCGSKGHIGYECTKPRMNRFVVASYPYIARYDTKRKLKEAARERGDGDRGSKRSKHSHSHTSHKSGRYGKDDERHSYRRERSQSREEHRHQHKGHKHHHREHGQDRVDSPASGKRKSSNKKSGKKDKKFRDGKHNKGVDNRDDATSDISEMNTPGPSKRQSVKGKNPRQGEQSGHKRQYEDGEIEEDDDIFGDFETHQVNNNEWWKSNDQPPQKKKKRNWNHPSEFSQADNSWQRESKNWKKNRGDHEKGQKGKWRQDHRGGSSDNRNSKNSTSSHQNQERPPFSGEPRNHFMGFDQIRGHQPDGKNSGPRGLTHSASWPQFRNQGQKKSGNRSGFIARNDRFVAMKNSCDITISLRK